MSSLPRCLAASGYSGDCGMVSYPESLMTLFSIHNCYQMDKITLHCLSLSVTSSQDLGPGIVAVHRTLDQILT